MSFEDFMAIGQEEELMAAPPPAPKPGVSFEDFLSGIQEDAPAKTPSFDMGGFEFDEVPIVTETGEEYAPPKPPVFEETLGIEAPPAATGLAPSIVPEAKDIRLEAQEERKRKTDKEYNEKIVVSPAEMRELVRRKENGENVDLEAYRYEGTLSEKEQDRLNTAMEEQAQENRQIGVEHMKRVSQRIQAHRTYPTFTEAGAERAGAEEPGFFRKAASWLEYGPWGIHARIGAKIMGEGFYEHVGERIKRAEQGYQLAEQEDEMRRVEELTGKSRYELKRESEEIEAKITNGEMNQWYEDILEPEAFFKMGGTDYNKYLELMQTNPRERDWDEMQAVSGDVGKWIISKTNAVDLATQSQARENFYDAIRTGKTEMKLTPEQRKAFLNDTDISEDIMSLATLAMEQPDALLKELGYEMFVNWPLLLSTHVGVAKILSAAKNMKALAQAGKLKNLKKISPAQAKKYEKALAMEKTKKAHTSLSITEIAGEEFAMDFGYGLALGTAYEAKQGQDYDMKSLKRDLLFSLATTPATTLIRSLVKTSKLTPRQFDRATKTFKDYSGLEKFPEANRVLKMHHKLAESRALDGRQIYVAPDDANIHYLTREQLVARNKPDLAEGLKPGETRKVYITGETLGETTTIYPLIGPDGVIEETAHYIQNYIEHKAKAEGGKGDFTELRDMIRLWEESVRSKAAQLGMEIPQGKETFAQAFTAAMGYADQYPKNVRRLAIPDEIMRGMHKIMGDDPVLRGDSYWRGTKLNGEPMRSPKKPPERDYAAEAKSAANKARDAKVRDLVIKYRTQERDILRERQAYLNSQANVVVNSIDETYREIMARPDRAGLKSFVQSLKEEIEAPIERSGRELNALKRRHKQAAKVLARTKEEARYNRTVVPAYQMKAGDKIVQKNVEEAYGLTKDFARAGFMTSRGELLDFGKPDIAEYADAAGGRWLFHEHVKNHMEALRKTEGLVAPWDYVNHFMDMGNIRIGPAMQDGVSINVRPTDAQFKMLRKYFNKTKEQGKASFVVEINPGQEVVKEGAKPAFNFFREYPFTTPTEKVISDIKNHFDGKPVQELTLAQQFHMPDYQMKELTIRGKKQRHPIRIVGKEHPYIYGNPWRELSLNTQKKNVRKLYDLMEEHANTGKPGKYFYEESSNMILSVTNGNLEEAKLLAKLMSVTSPDNTVQANMSDAIKLYYQYRDQKNRGIPLHEMSFKAGRYPRKKEEVYRAVFEDKPLNGPKVNDFYKNLMVNIEDVYNQGVTIDKWMMRAMGFKAAAPTDARYDFISKMVSNLADSMDWKPWQVQAAIWSTIRPMWNNAKSDVIQKGVKKGFSEVIEKTTPTGKKMYQYSVKDDSRSRYLFNEAMLKRLGREPLPDVENFSFVDAINDLDGRITWEAVPGKSTGHLEGIHELPFKDRYQYTYDIYDAMLDGDGNNIILKEFGLLDRDFVYMAGSWLGETNPSLHFRVPLPRKSGVTNAVASVDESAERMLNGAAAALGYFTHQEGVGWHVPRFTNKKADANGIQLNKGMPMSKEETLLFEQKLIDTFGVDYDEWMAIIPSDMGPRVVKFTNELYPETAYTGGVFKERKLSNSQFHDYIREIGESVLERDFKMELFSTASDLVSNNWKEAPDGKMYIDRIIEAGGPDLFRRLVDILAPKIRAADEAFAERHGLGKPREIVPIPEQPRLKPVLEGSDGAIPGTTYQMKSHADNPPPGHSGPGGQTFDITPEGHWEAFRRYFQDKFLPIARLQKDMEKAGFKITEQTDVYGKEIVMPGRAATKIEDLEKAHIDPLITYMKDNGINLKTLDDYVAARHAPERNAQIARINPEMPDGGSGIMNQEAALIMDEYRRMGKSQKLEAAARMVDKFHQLRQQILAESGLINEETLGFWRNTYEKYTPLRGFEDMDDPAMSSTGAPGVSRGYGDFIKEKRAMGRKSRAFSPVTNSVAMLIDAVVRAEKNRVGQSFYQMVTDNPNQKLWQVDKVEMRPMIDPHSGMVVYRKKAMVSPGPNEFPVKINGEQHVITINDPHIANAMKQMGTNNAGGFVRAFSAYNRMMAAINTSLYPVFVASNFVRDAITAGIHITGEQGARHSLNVMKNTPLAIQGILMHHAGKGKNNAWVKTFQQYREVGGKMGFFGLKTVEDMHREIIDKLGEGVWGKAVRTKDAILKPIEVVNEAVENGVRLASFKEALDMGLSPERAAIIAKELTVNFNRKGEIGQTLNAFYLFYNASVQGIFRMGGALAKNKKVQAIAGAATLNSFLIAEYNRAIAGKDDSGISRWDLVAPWQKERNLIFMDRDQSGKFTKVPLPYGYNIFNVLGISISEMIHGGDPTKAAANLAVSTVAAFNPLGSQASKSPVGAVVKTVLPSAIQPGVQHVLNENFAGIPIRPENLPFGSPRPESQLYFKGVRPVSKALTQGLNEATGGTINRPGKVDVSPELLDHYYDTYTGGLGRFVGNVVNLIYSGYTGGEVATKDIPFWNRFRGEIFDSVNLTRFYELSKDLSQYEADERMIRRSGTGLEKAKVKASRRAKQTATRLRQLSQRITELEARGWDEEKLKKLKDMKKKEADRFLFWYQENVLDKTQELTRERK